MKKTMILVLGAMAAAYTLTASATAGCSLEGKIAKLADFDTTKTAVLGQKHARYAYRVTHLDEFVTACPIEVEKMATDPLCNANQYDGVIHDNDLVLVDKKKTGDLHLNVWRKGVEILNLELKEKYMSDTYYAVLGGDEKIDGMLVHFFIRIDPDKFASGYKYYAIEEFYDDQCASERPLGSLESLAFSDLQKEWAKFGVAKRLSTKIANPLNRAGARRGQKNVGEGQGNTTGGGEPYHP